MSNYCLACENIGKNAIHCCHCSKTHTQFFNEGCHAYTNNQSPQDNPYNPSSPAHLLWERGWFCAKHEFIENNYAPMVTLESTRNALHAILADLNEAIEQGARP